MSDLTGSLEKTVGSYLAEQEAAKAAAEKIAADREREQMLTEKPTTGNGVTP